ncbi:O-antigen ligase family protein [Desulfosarcina ovata]|uniref:O-antigen ligase family protein n=1 Tax=Desulfosarcina ovata TaxID=83564 RepID=UPI0012D33B3C|nr:O-antigen ligase family protein [Desulfosarcina ovata]
MNINIWNYISDYEGASITFLNQDYNIFLAQRMAGTFFDSNLFAYYLLFPLIITVYYGIYRKIENRIFSSKTSIIIACIISTTIMLTLSRSGIFLMFSIGAFTLLKGKFKLKIILFLAIIYIPIFIWINSYVAQVSGSSVVQTIIERFKPAESSMIDKEFNRIIRMKSGINAISSNCIFGVGLGNLGHFIPSDIRKSYIITSHSLYIDIMSEVGILGFIVYALFILFLIINIYRKRVLGAYNLNSMLNLFLVSLLASQVIYSNLINPVFAIYFGVLLAFIKLFPNTNKLKRQSTVGPQHATRGFWLP